MFIQKIALASIVCLLVCSASYAQNKGLSKIDTSDLKRHLSFIASDSLEGRRLGTSVDGLGITANYLAENAKQIGLKPGDGSYFQPVPMMHSKPDNDKIIEVKNKREKVVFSSRQVIKLDRNPGVCRLTDESVVFIGFGEDLGKYDLLGKVVVVAQGDAESFKSTESFVWKNSVERGKIKAISEKQPKAILIITNPKDRKNKTYNKISVWFNKSSYSLKTENISQGPKVFLSVPKLADALLGKKGRFEKYLKEISSNDKTTNYKSEEFLNLKVGLEPEEIIGKNVIGIVEGSDPLLKDEYIVFLAHYDHIGVGKDGDVYNGADDNGSGTVAIMEVAEAFASLPRKPKRSIVFLWVTCEEIGHFGSSYYCSHPLYPLESTVAAINLDMVGRVYEGARDDVWKKSPKMVKDFDGLYTLSNDLWPQLTEINAAKCIELGIVFDTSLPKEPFLRASDHYNFHKNGVPILNYATGYHADYHKVGDEIEKISFEKIKRVADLCFLLGYEIANLEEIKY